MNDSKPIIETLIERERIRGATRMFAEGTDAATVTEDKARLVAHDVETYIAAAKMSRKDVAREIGVTPGVVSEVLAFKYRGDWRSIILDLDRWLEGRLKADSSPTSGTTFVWTSVAEEIRTVAQLVTQTRKIGLVYGPNTSGIGKSLALQAVHQETPGSFLITIEKVEASPTGLIRAIARALRLSDTGRNTALYAKIKEKLAGTSRLMMVDQIHNLRTSRARSDTDKAFYILADLHDATRSPQLWCGTADLVAYFRRGQNRDESLAQIRRRITYVRDLMQRTGEQKDGGRGEPLYTIEQIRQVFAKNKIRLTSDATHFLWRLACIPDSGALGTCSNLVLIATIVAEQRGLTSIDAKLLRAALRDSVQPETFDTLSAEITRAEPRLAQAM
jgi:DNA transposition AAA+ family ATPase